MYRSLLAALALFSVSSSAWAGGLGLLTTAGLHQTRAYYYDDAGNQGIDGQTRANYGGGIIAMLGDKDDKVQGVMRLWYLQDQAQAVPDTGSTEDAIYPDEASKGATHLGMFTAGVQWGLLGDPSKFLFTLETHAGSGFATEDAREFLLVEVGPGATYALSDSLLLFGSITADMRYRKRVTFSENVTLGARVMFD